MAIRSGVLAATLVIAIGASPSVRAQQCPGSAPTVWVEEPALRSLERMQSSAFTHAYLLALFEVDAGAASPPSAAELLQCLRARMERERTLRAIFATGDLEAFQARLVAVERYLEAGRWPDADVQPRLQEALSLVDHYANRLRTASATSGAADALDDLYISLGSVVRQAGECRGLPRPPTGEIPAEDLRAQQADIEGIADAVEKSLSDLEPIVSRGRDEDPGTEPVPLYRAVVAFNKAVQSTTTLGAVVAALRNAIQSIDREDSDVSQLVSGLEAILDGPLSERNVGRLKLSELEVPNRGERDVTSVLRAVAEGLKTEAQERADRAKRLACASSLTDVGTADRRAAEARERMRSLAPREIAEVIGPGTGNTSVAPPALTDARPLASANKLDRLAEPTVSLGADAAANLFVALADYTVERIRDELVLYSLDRLGSRVGDRVWLQDLFPETYGLTRGFGADARRDLSLPVWRAALVADLREIPIHALESDDLLAAVAGGVNGPRIRLHVHRARAGLAVADAAREGGRVLDLLVDLPPTLAGTLCQGDPLRTDLLAGAALASRVAQDLRVQNVDPGAAQGRTPYVLSETSLRQATPAHRSHYAALLRAHVERVAGRHAAGPVCGIDGGGPNASLVVRAFEAVDSERGRAFVGTFDAARDLLDTVGRAEAALGDNLPAVRDAIAELRSGHRDLERAVAAAARTLREDAAAVRARGGREVVVDVSRSGLDAVTRQVNDLVAEINAARASFLVHREAIEGAVQTLDRQIQEGGWRGAELEGAQNRLEALNDVLREVADAPITFVASGTTPAVVPDRTDEVLEAAARAVGRAEALVEGFQALAAPDTSRTAADRARQAGALVAQGLEIPLALAEAYGAGPSPAALDDVGRWWRQSVEALTLFEAGNASAALTRTLGLYADVTGSGLPEGASALRLMTLAAALSDAQTNEGMVEAFRASSLPSGSYRARREGRGPRFALNLYPGMVAGVETVTNVRDADGWTPSLGVALPVGVNWHLGTRGWASWSTFASILDLGAVLSYRLDDGAEDGGSGDGSDDPDASAPPAISSAPDISFQDVFSPSVSLILGLGESPFAIAATAQFMPSLRSVGPPDSGRPDADAFRLSLSLTLDLPLLNLSGDRD